MKKPTYNNTKMSAAAAELVNRIEETEKDKSYYAITIGGTNIISNFPHKQQPVQFKRTTQEDMNANGENSQYVKEFINRYNDKNKISNYHRVYI